MFCAEVESSVGILRDDPDLDVIILWDTVVSSPLLKRSAAGVPYPPQELFAQLMLSNVFRYSQIILRYDAVQNYPEIWQDRENLDEHCLWLSFAAGKRFKIITVAGTALFKNNYIPKLSIRRLEKITQLWMSDLDVVPAIERALSLDPGDNLLWGLYRKCLRQVWPEHLPPERRVAMMYLQCLCNQDQVLAYNGLAQHYAENEQRFLAMLCRLTSLSLNSSQAQVYSALLEDWNTGVFEPKQISLDPVTSCSVSVLLCTYNRPERLRQAIASVLAQTYRDFELIVINDGGDQSAENIVAQFNSTKIFYLYREHGGHRTALNHGLRVAHGKYISYLDDDDVYYPNHLATLVAAADANRWDFVWSRNRWVQGHWDDDRWIEDYDLTDKEFNIALKPDEIRRRAHIPDNTILHRRSIVNELGLFWEEPQRGGEWEYWVRCSRYHNLHHVNTLTCECRVLTPSLPLGQPGRARLLNELWSVYFGSEFGLCILAVAAFNYGDLLTYRQMAARIAEQYVYSRVEIYNSLLEVAIKEGSDVSRRLIIKLAKADPVRFVQFCASRRGIVIQYRASIPLMTLQPVLEFALRHPQYVLKRSQRKLKAGVQRLTSAVALLIRNRP